MATIRDVARHAGVSHTAVSAVINGKTGRVGEETYRRISASIRDLHFSPNRAARQLVTGKYDTVGICFASGHSSDFLEASASRILGSFADMAEADELGILLIPPSSSKSFEPVVTSLPSRSVDGVITIGPIPDDPNTIRAIENCPIPMAVIDSHPGLVMTSTVDTDNAQGIRNAVTSLVSQGHRRFLYFGPNPIYQCYVDRIRGFTDAIEESGLSLTERSIRLAQPDRIRYLIDEVLDDSQAPTAIVCGDRQTGVAALDALDKAGIRIPEDASVVVADGIDPEHKHSRSIVSVLIAYREMGRTAYQLLDELMKHQHIEPVHIKVPPHIIMPGSPLADSSHDSGG